MEAETIGAILSALGTGVVGGNWFGQGKQLKQVKEMLVNYEKANKFNNDEVDRISKSLTETRQMHKECEDGRKELSCQIDELRDKTAKMETIIQKHIRAK